jgi:hypothetical protein
MTSPNRPPDFPPMEVSLLTDGRRVAQNILDIALAGATPEECGPAYRRAQNGGIEVHIDEASAAEIRRAQSE